MESETGQILGIFSKNAHIEADTFKGTTNNTTCNNLRFDSSPQQWKYDLYGLTVAPQVGK